LEARRGEIIPTGWWKVLPDKALSPATTGLDRGGGRPPNDDENHQLKPVDSLYVTRMYIKHRNNNLEVFTIEHHAQILARGIQRENSEDSPSKE